LQLEKLQASGQVQIIASYRDPRDVCLSMVDAGQIAREKNRREFAEYTDLNSTLRQIEKQTVIFRKWGAIPGTVRLDYETLAFEPEATMTMLDNVLGIASDHAKAQHYAFNRAFTQKNRAVTNRRATDLSPEEDARLVRIFGTFIENVVEHPSDTWFAE